MCNEGEALMWGVILGVLLCGLVFCIFAAGFNMGKDKK